MRRLFRLGVPVLLAIALLPLTDEAAARGGKKKKPEKPKAKVDKQAMKALKEADKLVYRPLGKGLKDIRFEFVVPTIEGKLRCLWAYRAESKLGGARQARTITSRDHPKTGTTTELTRKERRKYAASLKEYFTLVAWPILITSFTDEAKGMNVEWKDTRGGMTILTPVDVRKSRWDKIAYVWDENGLPREIAWTTMKEDEEGPYRVEVTATIQWKQNGKYWVVSSMNTNRWGPSVVYEYDYSKVKSILLPTKVRRINPFAGIEEMTLENVQVNAGITDEQFTKWR
ncbi:MAG: hypothetical protein ACYS99_20325 [Planctomycetota bacterium]|jgi:hypothetical protein